MWDRRYSNLSIMLLLFFCQIIPLLKKYLFPGQIRVTVVCGTIMQWCKNLPKMQAISKNLYVSFVLLTMEKQELGNRMSFQTRGLKLLPFSSEKKMKIANFNVGL